MKPASLKEIKQELNHLSHQELLEVVLRLSRFKKENKELLSYLLFSRNDEEVYKEEIKKEIDAQFKEINTGSYYFMKKSMRKILRNIKKYSRYSGKKETEVELLIYFLQKMDSFRPSVHKSKTLENLYERQLLLVEKNLEKLHEDLQHDFSVEIEDLKT